MKSKRFYEAGYLQYIGGLSGNLYRCRKNIYSKRLSKILTRTWLKDWTQQGILGWFGLVKGEV